MVFIDEKKLLDTIQELQKNYTMTELEVIIKILNEEIIYKKNRSKQTELMNRTIKHTGVGKVLSMLGGS